MFLIFDQSLWCAGFAVTQFAGKQEIQALECKCQRVILTTNGNLHLTMQIEEVTCI